MNEETQAYNNKQSTVDQAICHLLATAIDSELREAENRIWHAHPVGFLEGNPIVGYSKQKNCIRLMFWSGADFGEEKLRAGTGKFSDASISYESPDQVDLTDLERWLLKARELQWDYKNLAKRKGQLIRLK